MAAILAGLATALPSVLGAVSGNSKEAQRESYLNAQATLARAGNAGAWKDISDWANGISATEYDGTNRGNEPAASRAYAQRLLQTLPPPTSGISTQTGTAVAQQTAVASVLGGSNFMLLALVGIVVIIVAKKK
jgi:hypothetical protein